MSKGQKQRLEAASADQGGGSATSSKFRQQSAIGEGVAGVRISSSRFRIIPGFLGASASAPATTPPVTELDIPRLYAKTDPLGSQIDPAAWQRDQDPIFIWEPPVAAPDVAGYSYAIDAAPDDTVDTTGTSYDVATRAQGPLTDGQHTFSVKALNTGGSAGKAITFDLWVDTAPPQISSYDPAPGRLFNSTEQLTIRATILDAASGVTASSVSLLLNGTAVPMTVQAGSGLFIGRGVSWREGANSLELRVADLVGNAIAPLIWSVSVDTMAPSGSVTINAGAQMTTSVHVTLGLSATDATSSVDRMLISNEELAGYVEEPFAALRELWRLNAVRGLQRVYVKFVDRAGNVSAPVSDEIELGLLAPETVITSGPAGFTPSRSASFSVMCPEGGCVFSFAFDNDPWSEWSSTAIAEKTELVFGNHYFRVKAARELNGTPGIQDDEEDPSPAERAWVVGVEPPIVIVPKGPPIKIWRLE